jgi:spermidine synthase
VLAHYLATDLVTRAFAASPRVEVNTDDRNIVEFGLARSVGRSGSNLLVELRELAYGMGASRPPLDSDAGINWRAVGTAATLFVRPSASPAMLREVPQDEQRRQAALRRFYQDGDTAGARQLWRLQAEPPRNAIELAMAAEILADEGSEAALPLIAQLRPTHQTEADIITAVLRVRQSRLEEAATAVASGIARLRTDPWPPLRYKQRALDLAGAVGARQPSSARLLFDALAQRFSVQAVDTLRQITRVNRAVALDFRSVCQQAIGALEPYVPWSQPLLVMRRDCYQAVNDTRLPAAVRDLDEYFSREPIALAPR